MQEPETRASLIATWAVDADASSRMELKEIDGRWWIDDPWAEVKKVIVEHIDEGDVLHTHSSKADEEKIRGTIK